MKEKDTDINNHISYGKEEEQHFKREAGMQRLSLQNRAQ